MARGSRDPGTEFLVRSCGILLHGDAVLCEEGTTAGRRQYALPGGHTEFGETLSECLTREFFEETGLPVEPEKLVYVHENFYTLDDVRTHEIGFYFLVDVNAAFPPLDREGYIPNREARHRMRLLPLADLHAHPLMPAFLREALPRGARDHFAGPTRHLVSREG